MRKSPDDEDMTIPPSAVIKEHVDGEHLAASQREHKETEQGIVRKGTLSRPLSLLSNHATLRV